MYIKNIDTLISWRKIDDEVALQVNSAPSLWHSKRLLVAIVLFVGFSNTIMITSNIDIAIIEMTSEKLIRLGNTTIIRPPQFRWDRGTIGVISSMHSYAGLLPFFGSFLASRFGGSTSSSICLIAAGILSIFHQAILYVNFYLFLACRFLIGLSTISYYVSTADIYSKWFPKKERSTLISFCYSGSNIGSLITYPLYGYIAQRLGWSMVFYISGITSVIVSILVLVVVKDRPSQDKHITREELAYILEETNTTSHKKVNHPYRKILTSAPVLALCAGKFTFMWVSNLLSESLPLYVKDMTQTSTATTGLISSIPILGPTIIYPLSGTLLDYWKNHSNIASTQLHKIIICAAFISTAALFIAVVLISNFTVSMGVFVLIKIIESIAAPVFDLLVVNIAPNDSSIIAAILVIIMSVSGIISRTLAGLLTINHRLQEWNHCFLLSDAILISGTVIFLKYGSSEAQSWSLPAEKEECRYLMTRQ